MFPLGISELVLIGIIIIVLLFGGKKLPELARAFGQAIKEYRRAVSEVTRPELEVKKEVKEEDIKEIAEKLGLETKGKSTEELAKEISRKLSEVAKEKK